MVDEYSEDLVDRVQICPHRFMLRGPCLPCLRGCACSSLLHTYLEPSFIAALQLDLQRMD